MSDTEKTQDPYDDGSVPADADLNPDGGDVAGLLPGGSRLDEGEAEPDLNARDIRPGGDAPLP